MVSNLSHQIFYFPPEIEKFIFNSLKGIFKPDFEGAKENINADKDRIKIYLGTYFPRSFAESYTIFTNLINNNFIKNNFETKNELFILVFCQVSISSKQSR